MSVQILEKATIVHDSQTFDFLGDLQSWLNKQEKVWLTAIAHEILNTQNINALLTQDKIGEYCSWVSNPSLCPAEVDLATLQTTINSNKERLVFKSIGPITGVAKLETNKPLNFYESDYKPLSIIYGDNGAGKSSYIRLIKKLSGKIQDDLLGNVFEEENKEQILSIEYQLGDSLSQRLDGIYIENNNLESILKCIDIFDSEIGSGYFEKSTALYIPEIVYFYQKLTQVIDSINKNFKDELNNLEQNRQNLFEPPSLGETSSIQALRKYLSQEISFETLQSLFQSLDYQEEINKLYAELQKDPSIELGQFSEKYDKVCELYTITQKAYAAVLPEHQIKINSLKTVIKEKQNLFENSGKNIGELDGIGTHEWKQMWQAAKEYSEKYVYQGSQFPSLGEDKKCVLCEQDLTKLAQDRFLSLDEFSKNKFEKELQVALSSYNADIDSLPPIIGIASLNAIYEVATVPHELSQQITQFWESYERIYKQYADLGLTTLALTSESIDEFKQIVDAFYLYVVSCFNQLEQLKVQSSNSSRERSIKTQINELEANKWVAQNLDNIKLEYCTRVRANELSGFIRATNTQAISLKTASIFKSQVSEAYIERFNTELLRLSPKRRLQVKLEESGNTKGQQNYGIKLINVSQHQPTKILSEGEKRIIQLAAFFANSCVNQSESPFIFDDPISSLGEEYEKSIVSRLVELSNYRQVIVFTHRLTLVENLIDEMDTLSKNRYFHTMIQSHAASSGIPSGVPLRIQKPREALNKLKPKIKQARELLNEQKLEEYRDCMNSIGQDLRIILENTIELYLLNDIVRRHRRKVITGYRLNKLAAIILTDTQMIENLMTKYSTERHSNSSELGLNSIELDVDTVNQDIDSLISWINEFEKRQHPTS